MFVFKAKSGLRTEPVSHVSVLMLHLFYISIHFFWLWRHGGSGKWGRRYCSLVMSAVQRKMIIFLSLLWTNNKYMKLFQQIDLNSHTSISLPVFHLFTFNPLYGEIEQVFPVHQHVLSIIYYRYYTKDGCLGHLQSDSACPVLRTHSMFHRHKLLSLKVNVSFKNAYMSPLKHI